MELRGYWREADGSRVTAAEAYAAWASHAYPLLSNVAGTYQGLVVYGDLAEQVQVASGIRTSVPFRHWIGKVLYLVVLEGHRRGDPPLTALVVHRHDGKVGEGYKAVLEVAGKSPITDDIEREYHAAAARLDCYRHFGAALPDEGGSPALAPILEARVRRPARSTVPAPRPSCSNCFVQLPVTGVCDSCS
ncbi:hypothetical protein [Micromonospora sp. AP08]|uniref:hypothetical protein n=1 Tax=Micromonospora sp. AP08 TaxID=2604467 RepID=UPI001CA368DE|nr:hypothetical protein [Micromonospora sp. AP08]